MYDNLTRFYFGIQKNYKNNTGSYLSAGEWLKTGYILWYAIQYKTQEAKTLVPTQNIEILRLLTVLLKQILYWISFWNNT